MIELNRIYNEDCLATLGNMEDGLLDLTVTSPPYNVKLGNNKHNKTRSYDEYDDDKPYDEYIEWMKSIFKLVYQKTKSGGRCVINIGSGQNGRVTTQSDIIQFMKDIGWIPLTQIIWDKHNCSNRTSFGSFNSPSCPAFPTPFEYILVFAKDSLKLQWKGETDLVKEDFVKWTLAKWDFAPERLKKVGHPAAFPVELPLRCVKMLSWKNSIVYDPFMGAGTTALACKQTGRNYIGSEISKEYIEIAEERLNSIENV
jgi:site-specific DNA-methyltransferase (adenine-specific)